MKEGEFHPFSENQKPKIMTIKATYKDVTRSDGKVNIKIRIIHKKRSIYLSTNVYIEPKYFDKSSGMVKSSHFNANHINSQIRNKILQYERIILSRMGESIDYVDVNTIRKLIVKNEDKLNFTTYTNRLVDKMRISGKNGNADIYETALRSIQSFTGREVVEFNEITPHFLEDYEYEKTKNGVGLNSISVYLRTVRSILNKAIKDDIISYDAYPFRKYKIKSIKTEKRNLPVEVIKAIKDFSGGYHENRARDIFMLSFYLIGINMVDLYYMKKDNLYAGRLEYKRRKTGAIVNVKVFPEALEIINRYKADNEYLFTFNSRYANHKAFVKYLNARLKNVARSLGITKPLSSYYARHSWATITISLGYNKDIVKYALAHSMNDVTDGYIEYNPVLVDNANKTVIEHINS